MPIEYIGNELHNVPLIHPNAEMDSRPAHLLVVFAPNMRTDEFDIPRTPVLLLNEHAKASESAWWESHEGLTVEDNWQRVALRACALLGYSSVPPVDLFDKEFQLAGCGSD